MKTLLLFTLILAGCSTPRPPDIFVFEQLSQRFYEDPVTHHQMLAPSPTCMKKIREPECGHGVAIVSGREVFVGDSPENVYSGKTWSQLKKESVYLPAQESYEPLVDYTINSCAKMGCSADVTRFKVKIDVLNGILKSIQ